MSKEHFSEEITFFKIKANVKNNFFQKKSLIYGLDTIQKFLNDKKYDLFSLKTNSDAGIDYINKCRIGLHKEPSQDLNFIRSKINKVVSKNSISIDDCIKSVPFVNDVFLLSSSENAPSVVSKEQNHKSRTLILAGEFNNLNIEEIFEDLTKKGMSLRSKNDLNVILEKISFFLDDEVGRLNTWFRPDGYNNNEINELIHNNLDLQRMLRRSFRDIYGTGIFVGILGYGGVFIGNIINKENGMFYAENESYILSSNIKGVFKKLGFGSNEIKSIPSCNALILNVEGKGEVLPFVDVSRIERNYYKKRGTNKNENFQFHFTEILDSDYFYDIREKNYEFKAVLKKIPFALTTAIQQYLLFFREYVSTAKQVKIDFDVLKKEEGELELTLRLNKEEDLERIQEYLKEYIALSREKFGSPINVEGDPKPEEIDLLRLRIEQQINNLNMEIKFRDYKINHLEKNIEDLRQERQFILENLGKSIDHSILLLKNTNNKLLENKVSAPKSIELSKECLSKGQISDAFILAKSVCKENDCSELNDVILLESKWNIILRQKNLGLKKPNEIEIEESRIIEGLIYILDTISDKNNSIDLF